VPAASQNHVSQPTQKVLDLALAALVALAAVLGAVPIRNSDAWVHLAAGRYLVTGPRAAGDPFAHTAGATVLPSASWMFDVATYGVFSVAGSYGLGACKVLMVALLACALYFAGGGRGAGWLSAVCSALAILAVTPWLNLQPFLASMMCFVLTLGYLERRTAPHADGANGNARPSAASYWPLFLLFAVWANADRWFLLGPLTLLAFRLGGLFPQARPSRPRIPPFTVVLGFAVCLASPRWYHGFRVPDELLLPVRYPDLAQDAHFRSLFLSVFGRGPLEARFLWSLPGAALAPLLVGGLLATALNRSVRHPARLMVGAGLLALTLYQARNAALLALALGVFVPRALLESWQTRSGEKPRFVLRPRQAVAIRAAIGLLLTALIALAWLGHLQPGRAQPRGIGTDADPSLALAAQRMAEWRRDGKLGASSKGFNDSPDFANYCAWFCPEEQGFLDSRLDVCGGAASEFALVRQELSGRVLMPSMSPGDRSPPTPPQWRDVLRRRKVDHIILADRDREHTQDVLRHVLAVPDEWEVLFLAGRVLVLAWRDPAARGSAVPATQGVDLAYQGLHPAEVEKAPAQAVDPPSSAEWWEAYLPVPDRMSSDRDEAALRNMIFEALIQPTRRATARECELAVAGGLVGRAAGDEPTGAALRLLWLAEGSTMPRQAPNVAPQLGQRLQIAYLMGRDDAPVGDLWAAIRASRRALADNPNDADAYLLLGQMYCRLAWNTVERSWTQFPALGQLRMQQAIGALQAAVRIKPEFDQAHSLLATIYRRLGIVDLARRHQQDFHKLCRDRGPLPGESVAAYDDRLDRAAQEAARLDAEESDRDSLFERKQGGLALAARVRLAHGLGLTDKALNMLLDTDPAAFGGEELHLTLDLLLWTGRAHAGRELLKPQHKQLLGDFEYDTLAARLAVATGNYADAQAHVSRLAARSTTVPELGSYSVDLETGLAFVVAKSITSGLRIAGTPHWFPALTDFEARLRVDGLSVALARAAEFTVLQGIIMLEHGESARAERHFRQALADMAHQADRGIHPVAAYYLHLLQMPSKGARPPGGGD
jgi:tetratricopeptide (TPR) repeat protein